MALIVWWRIQSNHLVSLWYLLARPIKLPPLLNCPNLGCKLKQDCYGPIGISS